MNVLPIVKNFFSYLAFFNTERTIREIKHQFDLRDSAYREKLSRQENTIVFLTNKLQHLEFEKKQTISELKKFFQRTNYLHRKLENARQERDRARQSLAEVHYLKPRAKISNSN